MTENTIYGMTKNT